ncbi:unnamed protein product [Fusarium langsethiae]|nr:unnamed protein product [Fusarium langsethiae]
MVRNLPCLPNKVSYFWLDTLCVPPDKANENDAQNIAIGMMRETYEKAAAVLVLDSWILKQKLEPTNDIDLLMRIVCSGWNARLWTLQEGVLAKRLIFKLAASFYDVDEGMQRVYKNDETSFNVSLKAVIIQRFLEIRPAFNQDTMEFDQIISAANALKFRATSVSTDEPLCLGTLLGLDVEEIARTPAEQRMRKLWSLVSSFPHLLLLDSMPRLADDRFSWAPKSFLLRNVSNSLLPQALKVAGMTGLTNLHQWEVTSGGLRVQQPGFLFYHTASSFQQGTCLNEHGMWYWLDTMLNEWNFAEQSQGEQSNVLYPHDRESMQRFGVICTQQKSQEPDLPLAQSGTNLSEFAILVSVVKEEKNVIYARRLCRASWTKLHIQTPINNSKSAKKVSINGIEVFIAESKENQEWLII